MQILLQLLVFFIAHYFYMNGHISRFLKAIKHSITITYGNSTKRRTKWVIETAELFRKKLESNMFVFQKSYSKMSPAWYLYQVGAQNTVRTFEGKTCIIFKFNDQVDVKKCLTQNKTTFSSFFECVIFCATMVPVQFCFL